MTTAQILAAVRRKILEETEDVVEDETLYLYATETQQDIARRAFPNSAILTASVNFVGGVGTLPAGFGTLYGDAQDANRNIYPELSIADFARAEREAITVEGGQLKLWPAVTRTVTVRYYPAALTIDENQEPSVDPYFHRCIIDGTLAQAFEDLQDEELARYYDEKYEARLAKRIDVQSNYEEGNQRGGVMFNGFRIVSDMGGPSGLPDTW